MLQKEFLARLIKYRRFTSGIEIGVQHGKTVGFLLTFCGNLHMISIDPYPQPEAAEMLNTFKGRFSIIKKTSDQAVKDIPGEFDFVWIDGDHSYEQVKRDILNYWPLVRIGGVLGGHDYVRHNNDVGNAVNEILGEDVFTWDDGVWWVEKRNAEIQK